AYVSPHRPRRALKEMADFGWPLLQLAPLNVSVNDANSAVSGGRTISGKSQTILADVGYWEIVLDQIRIRSNASVLQWRKIEIGVHGRLKTILVPSYDRKFAPVPPDHSAIIANMDGAIAANAVIGNIRISNGDELMPGMDFSTGERLYRLKTV